MLAKRIEEVSLNSWPALQQILFDGWVLRFSKGYTKRANSVNPLFGSSMDVNEKVDTCERFYAQKGLPPLFRLTPFSSPPELDQVLEGRKYRKIDPTLVLHLDLEDRRVESASSGELREETLDDWMDLFGRLNGSSGEHQGAHREVLQAIPSQRVLTSLVDAGRVVSCAVGVLEGSYFGIFDLITDWQQRNRGYATKLVAGLLGWAREHGGCHAYIQVMRSNEPARHMYAELGYEEAYEYWYRIAGNG
ncbi:MAG: hypothetical protein A2Y73_04095 [Chloroflexi bacterium RBG_13_56_8]|nr:MAG: hypothetical protein A2Y73_04095 [Chloroflexi bacterium RBG_13_56_8]